MSSEISSSHRNSQLTASQIRITNDLKELILPEKTIEVDSSESMTKSIIYIRLTPNEGYYKNGIFQFSIFFKETYPIDPPVVTCLNKIYHPNIDYHGNVCLNILREDWSPVLDLHSVLVGILFLFLEPNGADPLNRQAAQELITDSAKFGYNVELSLRGGTINKEKFDYTFKS